MGLSQQREPSLEIRLLRDDATEVVPSSGVLDTTRLKETAPIPTLPVTAGLGKQQEGAPFFAG